MPVISKKDLAARLIAAGILGVAVVTQSSADASAGTVAGVVANSDREFPIGLSPNADSGRVSVEGTGEDRWFVLSDIDFRNPPQPSDPEFFEFIKGLGEGEFEIDSAFVPAVYEVSANGEVLSTYVSDKGIGISSYDRAIAQGYFGSDWLWGSQEKWDLLAGTLSPTPIPTTTPTATALSTEQAPHLPTNILINWRGTKVYDVDLYIIDYGALQTTYSTESTTVGMLPSVVVEQVAELYNSYFPTPNVETEWQEFLHAFSMAFGALAGVAGVAVQGVIGNLAYDVLRSWLSKAKSSAPTERRGYYETLEEEMRAIFEILVEATLQNRGVRVEEVAGRVGIDDRNKVRNWFKVFGAKHTVAGSAACTYKFQMGYHI